MVLGVGAIAYRGGGQGPLVPAPKPAPGNDVMLPEQSDASAHGPKKRRERLFRPLRMRQMIFYHGG